MKRGNPPPFPCTFSLQVLNRYVSTLALRAKDPAVGIAQSVCDVGAKEEGTGMEVALGCCDDPPKRSPRPGRRRGTLQHSANRETRNASEEGCHDDDSGECARSHRLNFLHTLHS